MVHFTLNYLLILLVQFPEFLCDSLIKLLLSSPNLHTCYTVTSHWTLHRLHEIKLGKAFISTCLRENSFIILFKNCYFFN